MDISSIQTNSQTQQTQFIQPPSQTKENRKNRTSRRYNVFYETPNTPPTQCDNSETLNIETQNSGNFGYSLDAKERVNYAPEYMNKIISQINIEQSSSTNEDNYNIHLFEESNLMMDGSIPLEKFLKMDNLVHQHYKSIEYINDNFLTIMKNLENKFSNNSSNSNCKYKEENNHFSLMNQNKDIQSQINKNLSTEDFEKQNNTIIQLNEQVEDLTKQCIYLQTTLQDMASLILQVSEYEFVNNPTNLSPEAILLRNTTLRLQGYLKDTVNIKDETNENDFENEELHNEIPNQTKSKNINSSHYIKRNSDSSLLHPSIREYNSEYEKPPIQFQAQAQKASKRQLYKKKLSIFPHIEYSNSTSQKKKVNLLRNSLSDPHLIHKNRDHSIEKTSQSRNGMRPQSAKILKKGNQNASFNSLEDIHSIQSEEKGDSILAVLKGLKNLHFKRKILLTRTKDPEVLNYVKSTFYSKEQALRKKLKKLLKESDVYNTNTISEGQYLDQKMEFKSKSSDYNSNKPSQLQTLKIQQLQTEVQTNQRINQQNFSTLPRPPSSKPKTQTMRIYRNDTH